MFLALLVAPLVANRASAQICVADSDGYLRRGESLGLVYDSNVPAELVEGAIALWASCDRYASGFPRILNGREGTRSVEIVYKPAHIGPNQRCGAFSGKTIILYGAARNALGLVTSCGNLEQNLAHELGHVLGLIDAPSGWACRRSIMTHIRRDNARSRVVSASECRAVDNRWMTETEYVVARHNGELGPAPTTRTEVRALLTANNPY